MIKCDIILYIYRHLFLKYFPVARRHPMWITYHATASTAGAAHQPLPQQGQDPGLCGSWCRLSPTSPRGMVGVSSWAGGLRGSPALPRRKPWNPVPRKRPRCHQQLQAPGSRSRKSGLGGTKAPGNSVPVPSDALVTLPLTVQSGHHRSRTVHVPVTSIPDSQPPQGPLTQSTPTQRERLPICTHIPFYWAPLPTLRGAQAKVTQGQVLPCMARFCQSLGVSVGT